MSFAKGAPFSTLRKASTMVSGVPFGRGFHLPGGTSDRTLNGGVKFLKRLKKSPLHSGKILTDRKGESPLKGLRRIPSDVE